MKLGDRFRSLVLDQKQVTRCDDMDQRFTQLAAAIEEHTKESREQSLAFTKLEESWFWVGACIARENLE